MRERIIVDIDKNEAKKMKLAKDPMKFHEASVDDMRAVDMEYFKAAMQCKICHEPLLLQNIVKESQIDVASNFHVICTKYGKDELGLYVHILCTFKLYKKNYEINTKLSSASLHAEFGTLQMKNFLSVVGFPTMNRSVYKK